MKRLLCSLSLIAMCVSGMTIQESSIPRQFQEVDTNGDGVIQIEEVIAMIDGYFIGQHDHGVIYIHSLIDFFYDQKP